MAARLMVGGSLVLNEGNGPVHRCVKVPVKSGSKGSQQVHSSRQVTGHSEIYTV